MRVGQGVRVPFFFQQFYFVILSLFVLYGPEPAPLHAFGGRTKRLSHPTLLPFLCGGDLSLIPCPVPLAHSTSPLAPPSSALVEVDRSAGRPRLESADKLPLVLFVSWRSAAPKCQLPFEKGHTPEPWKGYVLSPSFFILWFFFTVGKTPGCGVKRFFTTFPVTYGLFQC